MRLTFSYMERMVGLLLVLTLFAALAAVVVVGQGKNWFRKHHRYHLFLSQGYNLDFGSKVKFLTTDIGEVMGVSLTPDNRVKVEVRVLAEYSSRLKTDSRAMVRAAGFIGNTYISIVPGTASAKQIEPGEEIPVKEVKSLTEVLEEFPLEQMLVRVENIVANVESISAGAARMLERVEKGEGNLGRVLAGDELYRQVRSLLAQVEAILKKVDAVAQTTRETAEQAGPAAGRMTARAEAASRDLPVITAQVKELLTSLQAVMVKVEKMMGDLQKAVGDLPELTRKGKETMGEVNKILNSVKGNFLIRGGLPPEPAPRTHGRELRAE